MGNNALDIMKLTVISKNMFLAYLGGRIKTFIRYFGVDGEKQKKSKVYLTKTNCDIGT